MARHILPPPIEPPAAESVNVIPSFSLALSAADLSPKTQETYLESVTQFFAFLQAQGMPTAPG